MGTLINGIKELYQSTLTTGSFFPVCDRNGSPTGHISADNLASVLGAYRTELIWANYAILNIKLTVSNETILKLYFVLNGGGKGEFIVYSRETGNPIIVSKLDELSDNNISFTITNKKELSFVLSQYGRVYIEIVTGSYTKTVVPS